jgi:hypothetical protein
MSHSLLPRSATIVWVLSLTIPFAATAADQAPGPCEQIVAACKSAGFVAGQVKEGSGLWVDCVGPLVRGTAPPANADKQLPSVPPDVIAACKAKRPGIGEGKRDGAKPAAPAPAAQH